jgi:hypothetical protein
VGGLVEPEPEPEPFNHDALILASLSQGRGALSREVKACGHVCYPSMLKLCCAWCGISMISSRV